MFGNEIVQPRLEMEAFSRVLAQIVFEWFEAGPYFMGRPEALVRYC